MKLGGDSNRAWNSEWYGILVFDDCCSTAVCGELWCGGEGELGMDVWVVWTTCGKDIKNLSPTQLWAESPCPLSFPCWASSSPLGPFFLLIVPYFFNSPPYSHSKLSMGLIAWALHPLAICTFFFSCIPLFCFNSFILLF